MNDMQKFTINVNNVITDHTTGYKQIVATTNGVNIEFSLLDNGRMKTADQITFFVSLYLAIEK